MPYMSYVHLFRTKLKSKTSTTRWFLSIYKFSRDYFMNIRCKQILKLFTSYLIFSGYKRCYEIRYKQTCSKVRKKSVMLCWVTLASGSLVFCQAGKNAGLFQTFSNNSQPVKFVKNKQCRENMVEIGFLIYKRLTALEAVTCTVELTSLKILLVAASWHKNLQPLQVLNVCLSHHPGGNLPGRTGDECICRFRKNATWASRFVFFFHLSLFLHLSVWLEPKSMNKYVVFVLFPQPVGSPISKNTSSSSSSSFLPFIDPRLIPISSPPQSPSK